jgi:FAD/FMN-containing dehydrogenase
MFPKVQRRVGGYNLDALLPERPNLAHLLVGSEGTLAFTTEVTAQAVAAAAHRVMGVCHFPSFRSAMADDAPPRRARAGGGRARRQQRPRARRGHPALPPHARGHHAGQPNCLLLVEFAGSDLASLRQDLRRLDACMADHGFPDAVVEVVEPARQRSVWDVREACLNIMMSMKGDGKPVSFIEDCAVPLEHLADYTDAVTELFARYGTVGTWYAHASVGCLHVRPILNMKDEAGARAMREIAEAPAISCAASRARIRASTATASRAPSSTSGCSAAPRLAFEEVKDSFDPRAG